MHPNFSARKKPELPQHLKLFEILYKQLDAIPIGPKYLGNYEFEDCKLSQDVIQFIKDHRSNFTVTQMATKIANEYGVFARAEAIAFYYYKGKDSKLWQVTRTEYIKGFEKRNNVIRNRNTKKAGFKSPEAFYKPFVVWAIENGYEYFQVSRVLGYCPGTVRRWANEWGYREYTMVRSKQPDLSGKVDRVERIDEVSQGELFEAMSIPERHELKLPKGVGNTKQQEEKVSINVELVGVDEKTELSQKAIYGYIIEQSLRDGHKVTLIIEPK